MLRVYKSELCELLTVEAGLSVVRSRCIAAYVSSLEIEQQLALIELLSTIIFVESLYTSRSRLVTCRARSLTQSGQRVAACIGCCVLVLAVATGTRATKTLYLSVVQCGVTAPAQFGRFVRGRAPVRRRASLAPCE